MIKLLKIRKEERVPAAGALLLLTALQVLVVVRYFDAFSRLTEQVRKTVLQLFQISGFDPLTYIAVSDWDTVYNVYRHPLLAFFVYPLYWLNRGLLLLTGLNLMQVVVAALLLFSAFYSFIFMLRIARDIIGVSLTDSVLLATLLFSFAYVLIAAAVPDHFMLSMLMLLLTLYVCGRLQQSGRRLSAVQTVLLFILTAGISLNNGIKTYLAALFTNGRRFFHWRFLLLGVILPCALMWGFARVEYKHFVWPKEMARHELKMKKDREVRQQVAKAFADTASVKDSATVAAGVKAIMNKRAKEKYRRDHQKIWNRNTGKPMAKGEFMRWTDISTSRWQTAVENLFGESLQLHEDYVLGDVLRNRPVIVHYRWWGNYMVEAVLVALLLTGIWCGRRSRFLWMAMSFFALDLLLHMGLGFGINEVYIMTPHWVYVLPIAIGYLLKHSANRWLRVVIAGLAAYLLVWNLALLVEFLYIL